MDHTSGHGGHEPTPGPGKATDPLGGHGMAVIGEQAVYFSHLPMFMSPHHYQVILEVELEGDGDPQKTYFTDRRDHPDQRLYTFQPVPFVLPALFPVGQAPPEATSFEGSLHRGHFERNPSPALIAAGVTVRVRNVIHQHQFQPDFERPEELRYLLFGKGSEMFLAHLITGPPDFDQLISVSVDEQLSDEDLGKGMVVKLGDRRDALEDRIRPTADPELHAVAEIDGRSQPIVLRPKLEYYLESGELAEAM